MAHTGMVSGERSRLDEPVRRLLERIAGPAAAGTPDLEAIGAALIDLASDAEYLRPLVQRLGDTSGSLPLAAPARGPRLGLVHRLKGQMGAIHDHGTWIAIAPVIGLETHRRWRVNAARPTAMPDLVEERGVAAGDLVTLLPPDDVHDHGHVAGHGDPAYVLILAGDDQRQFARNEWDLATGRRRHLAPGEPGRWLASEPMPTT